MGFLKKRGKPRQYKIETEAYGYSMLYKLYVWNRFFMCWDYLHLRSHTRPDALETLRKAAARAAKAEGYGDNYEITELV